MSTIYKLKRSALRLQYKIRHHKGHGIHSPFVFNLVNKVIEEKTPYYAYEDILYFLDEIQLDTYRFKKEHRLAFRLANYFQVKSVLELGLGNGVNTLALLAPHSEAKATVMKGSSEEIDLAQTLYAACKRNIELGEDIEAIKVATIDCLSIDLKYYPNLSLSDFQKLISCLGEKSFVMIKSIRANSTNQRLWREILDIEERTVVLDLFHIGLVFFDPRLYRWKYQISY